jgi:transcriptional regulator with XRE-family HTH domain
MFSSSKRSLIQRIRRNKETRVRLVENNLSEGIAFQISATRDARGWTQQELADAAGIANNLPRLESPEYGKQTLTSLKKIASALDVALVVRFVPFSQYVDWLSGTRHLDEGLRPEALAVPSFEDEEEERVYDFQKSYFVLHQPVVNATTITPQAENDFAQAAIVNGSYSPVFTLPTEVAS